MSDPTAAEAAAEGMRGPLDRLHPDLRWEALERGRSACEGLGIDPDSPVSLLHWHATQQERERCYRIADQYADRVNNRGSLAELIASQIDPDAWKRPA